MIRVITIFLLVILLGLGFGQLINDAVNGEWKGLITVIPLAILTVFLFKILEK